MKWLHRIFKDSSSHRVLHHTVLDGHYKNNYADGVDSDLHDKLKELVDNEELDHAIALSLSEDKYIISNGDKTPEVDADEDLARALHASSKMSEVDVDEELAMALHASVDLNECSKIPDAENDEDLARALHESNKASQVDDDEALALTLQASLDLDQLPPLSNSSPICATLPPIFPIPHVPSGWRMCEGCKHAIGYGRFLSCMGALWHPQCFRCYDCDNPISDHEFSMSGNNPYHKSCYKKLFHPRCDVCQQFIPTNSSGLIEYRAHPFWGQRYCPLHEYDSTPRCCSCERVEPRDTQYISLGDGRKLCLECLDSSIMDTDECQPLYHEIRDFYEGMNMKVEQQIPMLLVERQALNEAMEGEKEGHHHIPETRGLCLSEEQTLDIVIKKPRIGAGNRLVDMKIETKKLTRQSEVTAILILYGLPRLLTGSILAHELMHAWLRLNGFQSLPPEVEEGICQVLAHMWLESEVMAGSSSSSNSSSKKAKEGKSEVQKKLGDFFLHQIAMDTSPVYGEGFRAGHAAMVQHGLRRTLDHIKLTSSFPL